MNFLELQQMLGEAFQRTDLEHNYGRWINQAIRKIQQDRDWGCMRRRPEIQVDTGQSSVAMPADYKSLTAEQFPINVRTTSSAYFVPCDVVSLEQVTRAPTSAGFQVGRLSVYSERQNLPVYIDQVGDGFWLVLPSPASEVLIFRVSYYGFLPPLAADGDSNHLTREYPEMVEAKVKSLAFSRVNEFREMVEPNEVIYAARAREAGIDDFRRSNQGRKLRMGG